MRPCPDRLRQLFRRTRLGSVGPRNDDLVIRIEQGTNPGLVLGACPAPITGGRQLLASSSPDRPRHRGCAPRPAPTPRRCMRRTAPATQSSRSGSRASAASASSHSAAPRHWPNQAPASSGLSRATSSIASRLIPRRPERPCLRSNGDRRGQAPYKAGFPPSRSPPNRSQSW